MHCSVEGSACNASVHHRQCKPENSAKKVNALQSRRQCNLCDADSKKSSSKHINMRSSFKDLDATSLFVKKDFDLDPRFERYFIFRI